jgi:hypothetical protein
MEGDPAAGDDPVELGVALLERLEHDELSVAEAMDRIELVTTDPNLQRRILREAETRGAIERDDEAVRPAGDTFVRFESEVVVREGEFDCRRCGASITEGHFLKLEDSELGAFGSSCIRKVTGRE